MTILKGVKCLFLFDSQSVLSHCTGSRVLLLCPPDHRFRCRSPGLRVRESVTRHDRVTCLPFCPNPSPWLGHVVTSGSPVLRPEGGESSPSTTEIVPTPTLSVLVFRGHVLRPPPTDSQGVPVTAESGESWERRGPSDELWVTVGHNPPTHPPWWNWAFPVKDGNTVDTFQRGFV